jgi:hypothetical protein
MEAGLKIALKSADQAGLPLLERDVQALTRLTQDVAKQNGVINVSIIDHKNKIIAFTDPEQLLSVPSASVSHKDGVSYWRHRYADNTPAVGFSSEITYAGTKIGQVFLAMDAGGSSGLLTVFMVLAIASLLVIVFSLLIVDFGGVRPLKAAIVERIRLWIGEGIEPSDGRDVICPVCGQHKPLSRSFLLPANFDRYALVRPAATQDGSAHVPVSKGINLRELSRRDDLGWLRKQMIRRCADIIKTLAGEGS